MTLVRSRVYGNSVNTTVNAGLGMLDYRGIVALTRISNKSNFI
jgi:hypothetical protein